MRPSSGTWLVTTYNASYELDFELSTVKRVPSESGRRLAHDGLRLRLVTLFRGPSEGEPMVYTARYVDGTEDLYRTTAVIGVDKLV